MNKIELASVSKYNTKGKLFIHSYSRIQMGGSIASEPFIWLESSSTPVQEIAKNLIVALKSTKENVPRPTDWEKSANDFLKAAGLKKNKDLYNDALNVGVVRKDGVITFTPMINMGSKGFENVPNAEFKIPDDASMEKIGETLELAFRKCE